MARLVTTFLVLACMAIPAHQDVQAGPPAGFRLQLSTSTPTLKVGQEMAISLSAHNASSTTVRVVRPLDGSWDDMRQPAYSLEFLDDKGNTVPDALGFGPRGRCGLTNALGPGDVISVSKGKSALLSNKGAFMPYLKVHPSALPGRYKVRAHYRVNAISQATPMMLVSNTIDIHIKNGDAALWTCRRDQLAAMQNNHEITFSPGHLAPVDPSNPSAGLVALTTSHEQVYTQGQISAKGTLWALRIDPQGRPTAAPTSVDHHPSNSIGHVTATRVPDGLVTLYTPGAVGGRTVRSVHIGTALGGLAITRNRDLLTAPGNPYVTQLARSGKGLGALYGGATSQGEPLLFRSLDLKGKATAGPVRISNKSNSFQLKETPKGFLALWSPSYGKQTFAFLDPMGRPTSAVQAKAELTSLVAMRPRGAGIELIAQDSSVRGDDPSDTMGMFSVPIDPTGTPGAHTALSPTSRHDPYFGDADWIGDTPVRAYVDRTNALSLQIGHTKAPITLSNTTRSAPRLWIYNDLVYLAWPDHRDDTSPACLHTQDCVTEVYIAVFDASGHAHIKPSRITQGTKPKRFNPRDSDWQRHCQTAP